MIDQLLPLCLGIAVLAPLVSFFLILCFGARMGKAGEAAAYVAVLAIGSAAFFSFAALFLWLSQHWPEDAHHHGHDQHAAAGDHSVTHDTQADHDHASSAASAEHGSTAESVSDGHAAAGASSSAAQPAAGGDPSHAKPATLAHASADQPADHASERHPDGAAHAEHGIHAEHGTHAEHGVKAKAFYAGDFNFPGIGPWVLGQFGNLRLSISYYIDSLTICMFCMVTFIATLIHLYAMGYMHDELHAITDKEVTLSNGNYLHRAGRFHRFFQYLSLFCFSMLGLVIAGNIAMVFVFWELVGICSYFLIGFYVERKSASTAANKAFIVNRVGDFGMIIGLMAIWTGLGTFSFADVKSVGPDGHEQVQPGIFSLVRSGDVAQTPAGMVKLAAAKDVAAAAQSLGPNATEEAIAAYIDAQVPAWRDGNNPAKAHYGYWLLIIGGLGIFAGCVGKSAQFPLHVWLPDAMEGPTPVSALVHSATMVAAGVYLVGRFFPVFTPEVLLVIACVGCITLLLAASIAITATDIKRVLAYSTVSQLGYMMLALGVGGWLAGMMHLVTHAFFKSLLFMCSGSVIHAVHTNDMRQMGGLRKKMPVTAYTMLVGCLAIAGAGVPFIAGFFGGSPLTGVGFSGFYSKDAILEQSFLFMYENESAWGGLFFLAASAGAVVTSFYMFRLWFMTFAGQPRDEERFDHAHESPPIMFMPLVILAVMAIAVAWSGVQAMIAGAIALIVFWFYRGAMASPPAPSESHAAHHPSAAHHGSEAASSHASAAAHGHATERHVSHAHSASGKDTHHASAHGDSGHGHHGHEDHGHDGHGHESHGHAPDLSWVGRVPIYASLGFLVLGLIWGLTPLNTVVLSNLLESARPDHTLAATQGTLIQWTWPSEADSHASWIVIPVSLLAIGAAGAGFFLALAMYGWGWLNPEDTRRQFDSLYRLLVNKWWFDELYDWVFVKPSFVVSRCIAGFDKSYIDRAIDALAFCTIAFSRFWEKFADRFVVDRFVNVLAENTYALGVSLRRMQTGSIREYVMFIVVGSVAIFLLISFFWNPTLAG